MAPYKTVEVDERRLEIAYRYRPAGSHLLVLLHGMGCTRHAYDTAFVDPALDGYSLLSFDWPGQGASSRPRRFEYALENLADVGLALLEAFNYQKVSLIAHSMGGGVGILMAQRVRGLHAMVSIEGSLLGGSFSEKIAVFDRREYIANGHEQLAGELREHKDTAFTAWSQWFRQADPAAVHELAQSMLRWAKSGELLQRFNRLPRKAYLYSDSCDMSRCLPLFQGVVTQLIKSCGHFPMLDNPHELYRRIDRLVAAR